MYNAYFKDLILFAFVSVIIAVVFTFTNCGQENESLNSHFQFENYVFLSYQDNNGQEHIRKTEFKEADGDVYIDGDVLLAPSNKVSIGQVYKLHNATLEPEKIKHNDQRIFYGLKSSRRGIWNEAAVPFELDQDLYEENKEVLLDLIKEFNDIMVENEINLKFTPRTNENDYIYFVQKDLNFPMGGQSYIGRQGGKQLLKIREDNFSRTIIHHEILHALGFKHEHQRSDRNLNIIFENVVSSLKFNFAMYSAGSSIGKYDSDSILHYHSYAFSKNGEATMLKNDGGIIRRNRRLSVGDIYSLKTIYGSTQALPDGVYTYKGQTYDVSTGKYCILKTKNNDLKLSNLSLMDFNTLILHGPKEGLLNSPHCN